MTKVRKIKVSKKESKVGYQEWINAETGESQDFVVVNKTEGQDVNWWKVWLPDLLVVMGLIGNSKLTVLKYILDNISPHDNTFSGTIREIAKGCSVSTKTVQRVMNILTKEGDFLVKIGIGRYQINPNVLAQGRHKKRMGLMIQYEKSKST